MDTAQSINNIPVTGVDTHAHIFTQQLRFVTAGEGYIPDYDATLTTFLQKLERHNLSHAVLIQPSFLGSDNSHLLGAVKNDRRRLRAMVIAGPETPEKELDSLKSQGAVGTRLILYGTGAEDYTSAKWKAFAKRLAERDLIVEIYGESDRLRSVCDPLLKENCRLLIDHYGRPDPRKAEDDEGFTYLLTLAQSRRVWIDVSGPYRTGQGELGTDLSRKYFSILRQHFGLDRLLWGSDWPCVQFEPWASYEKSVQFLKDLLPQEEDQEQVLRKAPMEMFDL